MIFPWLELYPCHWLLQACFLQVLSQVSSWTNLLKRSQAEMYLSCRVRRTIVVVDSGISSYNLAGLSSHCTRWMSSNISCYLFYLCQNLTLIYCATTIPLYCLWEGTIWLDKLRKTCALVLMHTALVGAHTAHIQTYRLWALEKGMWRNYILYLHLFQFISVPDKIYQLIFFQDCWPALHLIHNVTMIHCRV